MGMGKRVCAVDRKMQNQMDGLHPVSHEWRACVDIGHIGDGGWTMGEGLVHA